MSAVYFIRLSRYVKVGVSDNPERRCQRLFSSSTAYAAPWDCPKGRADRHLLGYVPGDLGDENAAHRALEDFGVGCEFFLAEPLALDYIDRTLAAGRVLRESVERPEGSADWVGQVKPDPEGEARAVAALNALFAARGAA